MQGVPTQNRWEKRATVIMTRQFQGRQIPPHRHAARRYWHVHHDTHQSHSSRTLVRMSPINPTALEDVTHQSHRFRPLVRMSPINATAFEDVKIVTHPSHTCRPPVGPANAHLEGGSRQRQRRSSQGLRTASPHGQR